MFAQRASRFLFRLRRGVAAEQRDAILTDLGAELGIVYTHTFARSQAQHADFAFVSIVVHLVGRLACGFECVHGRHHRLNLALDTSRRFAAHASE